jgi:hypothetical protein
MTAHLKNTTVTLLRCIKDEESFVQQQVRVLLVLDLCLGTRFFFVLTFAVVLIRDLFVVLIHDLLLF